MAAGGAVGRYLRSDGFRPYLRYWVRFLNGKIAGEVLLTMEVDSSGEILGRTIESDVPELAYDVERALIAASSPLPEFSPEPPFVGWRSWTIRYTPSDSGQPEDADTLIVVRPRRRIPPRLDIASQPQGIDTNGMTHVRFDSAWLSGCVRYPEQLWRRGVEGSVLVEAFVEATGVIHPTVVLSDDDLFEGPAMKCVLAASYEPAREAGGRPIGEWIVIPIEFRLTEREKSPSR